MFYIIYHILEVFNEAIWTWLISCFLVLITEELAGDSPNLIHVIQNNIISIISIYLLNKQTSESRSSDLVMHKIHYHFLLSTKTPVHTAVSHNKDFDYYSINYKDKISSNESESLQNNISEIFITLYFSVLINHPKFTK